MNSPTLAEALERPTRNHIFVAALATGVLTRMLAADRGRQKEEEEKEKG